MGIAENIILHTDSYKHSHHLMYPPGTESVPFRGMSVDGDGNVVDPPPGPKRDRAIALREAWRRYWKGDSGPLEELGVISPDDVPPPVGDPDENG